MSKLKDSMMKSDEKLLERAFRLMEYKYLATKYNQDMKHRAVGGGWYGNGGLDDKKHKTNLTRGIRS